MIGATTQSLRLVTSPSVECISLERARKQLRLTAEGSPPSHPDDELIQEMIIAARERIDGTNLATVPAVYELRLDRFPDADITISKTPLIEVLSVAYLDDTGVEQTVDPAHYLVLNAFATASMIPPGCPVYGAVSPKPGFSWPSTQPTREAVRIQFRAGYASEASPEDGTGVPFAIRAAMLLMMADLYQHRESVIVGTSAAELPNSVRALLEPYYLGTWTW